MRAHACVDAECLARQQTHEYAGLLEHRQHIATVVDELGIDLFVFARQRHPRLDAVHGIALRASTLESLRVRDALSRGHPVHFTGMDRFLGTDAIPMHDLPVEEIRDGREADVGMRPDINGA